MTISAARLTGLCLTLVALAPAALAAQEPRLVDRLAEPIRVQIDAILDSARAEGIPTEPLVDRALEGAAKRAPGDLIVGAVSRLRDELRVSRAAFGDAATDGEVTAGASALRAGATGDDLAALRTARADQTLTVAAGVLADLVAVGVPADTAIAAVLALAPITTDAAYIAFRLNVERDIALGASPVSALGVRLGVVAEAADALDPASVASPSNPAGRRKP